LEGRRDEKKVERVFNLLAPATDQRIGRRMGDRRMVSNRRKDHDSSAFILLPISSTSPANLLHRRVWKAAEHLNSRRLDGGTESDFQQIRGGQQIFQKPICWPP